MPADGQDFLNTFPRDNTLARPHTISQTCADEGRAEPPHVDTPTVQRAYHPAYAHGGGPTYPHPYVSSRPHFSNSVGMTVYPATGPHPYSSSGSFLRRR